VAEHVGLLTMRTVLTTPAATSTAIPAASWSPSMPMRQSAARHQSTELGVQRRTLADLACAGVSVDMPVAHRYCAKLKRFTPSDIFPKGFVAVGITFKVMMHPTKGLINRTIEVIGFTGPKWLTDPQIALLSVALVDVWKGVGLATVIFIAGIVSIPSELLESVSVDGGNAWRFRSVILPLSKPATFTVILLSLIGGLRSFDLIWTMTGGGPGFTTDVLASTIFKNYQAGFYGLSTAGNVILFLLVTAIVFPLNWFLRKRELKS
jgi:ABC-type polysaccharide transport system permease subunit